MSYEDAFKESVYWIKHYYKMFNPNKFSYEDYYQECALKFYENVKKMEALKLLKITKKMYKYVMIRLLYRIKNHDIKYIILDNEMLDYLANNVEMEDSEFSIELKPHLKEVATLIADGYETKEICEITNKKINTIYSYVKMIKKKYANYLGIKNYQGKHTRAFTRSEEDKKRMSLLKKDKFKKVNALDDNGNIVYTFESIRSASKFINGEVSVALLKGNKCKGYKWEYAD